MPDTPYPITEDTLKIPAKRRPLTAEEMDEWERTGVKPKAPPAPWDRPTPRPLTAEEMDEWERTGVKPEQSQADANVAAMEKVKQWASPLATIADYLRKPQRGMMYLGSAAAAAARGEPQEAMQYLKGEKVAPTGKELAASLGASTEKTWPTPFKDIMYRDVKASPADYAGAAIETVTDPLTWGGTLTKAAPFAARKAGQLASDVTLGSASKVAGVPAALDEFANERALKAALGGPNVREVRRIAGMTTDSKDLVRPQQRIQDMGDFIYKEGLLPFGSKSQDMGPRVTAALEKSGENLGNIASSIDEAVKHHGNITANAVNTGDIANRIEDYARNVMPVAEGPAIRERLMQEADRIRRLGGGNITFKEGVKLKNQYQFKIVTSDLLTSNQDAQNAIRRAIKDVLQETADSFAEAIPEAASYAEESRRYGKLSDISRMIAQNYPRDISNRFISPSDYFSSGVGFAGGAFAGHGDPVEKAAIAAGTAAAAGMANKFMRQRGSSMAGNIAKGLAPGKEAIKTSLRVKEAIDKVRAGALVGTKWEKPFNIIMQTGAGALPAYIHTLYNTDPEFRALMDRKED